MPRSRALASLFAALTIATAVGAGLTAPAAGRHGVTAADQGLVAQLGGHPTIVRHAETGRLRLIAWDTAQPRPDSRLAFQSRRQPGQRRQHG